MSTYNLRSLSIYPNNRFVGCCVAAFVCAISATIFCACAKQASFPGDSGVLDSSPWPQDVTNIADQYVNPCAPNPSPSVSGIVYAPNGIDPVAGASIHVPLALFALPPAVQCETCAVTGKFKAQTYAEPDGSFSLSQVPLGEFTLVIQKGYFRRVLQLSLSSCGNLELTKEQTTLPGQTGQYSPDDMIPNIAVVTGAWDKLEKVLEKLGVEEINIYNGKDLGTGAKSMQALLQNGALMRSHHLLFVNCGTQFEGLVTSPGPAQNNLREYVRQGGHLFVTDFSYDFVEQTFPEFIDFEGSEIIGLDQPETHNAAELGTEDIDVLADVLDKDLKSWLDLPVIDALQPDKKIQILGFQTGWAVQKTVNNQLVTKTWVQAPVLWAGGSGMRPLTSTYEFADTDNQGCGRVLFSSYHTWGNAAVLLPQERVLEYLILEIGACPRPQ